MLNILDHISLRSTQKAIFFSVAPLLLLLSARDGAGKGRVEGIVQKFYKKFWVVLHFVSLRLFPVAGHIARGEHSLI